ncbi:restriction endonuclease subunit S [Treponema berlinense]|uniref:restriction endonuclease subunit S n=1 Tax=Treponema berlinense TaxID=225004 RepID=UPI0023529A74|nr:restriction endonuclease subunit S [Treponema berlinense]
MQTVKWGEFKLGDLFEIENTLSFNSDRLVDGAEYDYITRTSLNQGILQTTGFVNEENINPAGTWSLGLLQMDFFYRNKPWYAGQFVRKIVPKITIPENAILFFQTLLNLQKPILLQVLVRHVDETFRNTKIHLPQMQDGTIDFDFMESFIRELEEERIRELSAYLTVSGLSDATLTEREKLALQNFDTLEWQEFRMGDLFDRVSTAKLPYKAADLPKEATAENPLPCLTSSFMNQGLNYYAPKENATVLKHVISIPSNSDVYRAYYQSHDFTVLSDAYAICWNLNDREISAQEYLFMVACINQVTDLPIYSYKNKLGGWNVVQDKYIMLPVRDGAPDYATMQNFISAVQKLVIKDVVKYAEDKINATKKVVKKEVEYKTNEDKSFLSVAESADYKKIPR